MTLEQQEFNLKIKIKERKPTAVDLSEADISSLISFPRHSMSGIARAG